MKTIKSTVFFLLVLFLVSCTKEDQTNNDVSENAKVSNYLKTFYSKNYQLGKSVVTKIPKEASSLTRTTEIENLVITEVFVGNSPIARGYVLTDKITNAFLYFIDVDRVNFKLTSVKIDVNDTKVFNDINDLDKYFSTNELDYIQIAEDYASGNSTVETSKFWGWGPIMHDGPCVNGVRTLYQNYYVLFINTGGVRDVPDPYTGGSLQEPCGEAVLGED